MGLGDKINHAAEDVKGKAKEALADAKGDQQLKAEGKRDQASANVKKAGDSVKDAWKSATD